jgi:hypothetical protein
MKVTKRIVVAGVAALALLAMPAGLSVQSSQAGVSLSIAPAGSTAYAASNTQQPVKPPSTGTTTDPGTGTTTHGTFTTPGKLGVHNGSTARMQGFQTHPGKGRLSDSDCQSLADQIQAYQDAGIAAGLAHNYEAENDNLDAADALESAGLGQGCAFIY